MAAVCLVLLAAGANSAADQYLRPVDPYSYQLGILGAFSEIVKLGVKTLALSEVMSPEDMDAMMHDATVVARRNGVELYRESELLVTDLYPADVAEGKDVLLVYTGDTLEAYLALKAEKTGMLENGTYTGAAREDLARKFGRLLSYPDGVIDELIAKRHNN